MKNKSNVILLAFLAMGFADVVGPMVSLAKTSFNLSNTVAQLLPFTGFLMFGLLSIPMGLYQDRRSKKHTLLLGLAIAFVGLLIPMLSGMYGKLTLDTSSPWQFYVVLLAILLLGAGATILQVSGNPIMRDVSGEGSYARNLTIGQTIKAIGSSMGFLVPPLVARYFGLDWTILFPIYTIILLLALVMIKPLNIVEKRDPNSRPASLLSCFQLLVSNSFIFMMVMAIFLYVGAEVSMSSGVPLLLEQNYNIKGFSLIISWGLFFCPILIGRFTGSIVLRWLPAPKFLLITILMALFGIVMLLLGSREFAYAGIVLTGLGFANIFPLIFSIAIDAMPERNNEISGLMVTAIIGGAIVPLLMGIVGDAAGLVAGFLVPLCCILLILLFSILSLKHVKE